MGVRTYEVFEYVGAAHTLGAWGAWVFAQPSRVEGWGLSVIEAAACGTPTVAMRVPGLSDAIVDGETGVLADDWGSFEDAIITLLRDAALRDRMAIAAQNRAQRFTWQRTADELLATLKHAMRQRRPR